MTISLYDISVASNIQVLGALEGALDKGLTHFREGHIDPDTVVETRIAPDMRPFRFQVQHATFHSLGAIQAIQAGKLEFPGQRPEHDYAGLQALVAETRAALIALQPEDVNALAGRQVHFSARGEDRVFSAEDFVLSFSLPNFHFHAGMAYAIMRAQGVPIGKADFLGMPRWTVRG